MATQSDCRIFPRRWVCPGHLRQNPVRPTERIQHVLLIVFVDDNVHPLQGSLRRAAGAMTGRLAALAPLLVDRPLDHRMPLGEDGDQALDLLGQIVERPAYAAQSVPVRCLYVDSIITYRLSRKSSKKVWWLEQTSVRAIVSRASRCRPAPAAGRHHPLGGRPPLSESQYVRRASAGVCSSLATSATFQAYTCRPGSQSKLYQSVHKYVDILTAACNACTTARNDGRRLDHKTLEAIGIRSVEQVQAGERATALQGHRGKGRRR